MSSKYYLSKPLDAEIKVFHCQEEYDAYVNNKRVTVLKPSNSPGATILNVNCGTFGSLLILPFILPDLEAVEKKAKEEADKR
jgi:hypothetical protein